MDFRFTATEERFREEVRGFLKRELPPDWGGEDSFAANEADHALGLEFDRKLSRKGWLTMAWPKEYGGQSRSHIEQLIFNEERGYFRAPSGGRHGIDLCGPTIMVCGTEEQKREHLPYIARAERIWCQGFTEPGSGSDLASLQTRAEEDGDDFVLNGQKVFTTNGHYSDWCFVLARTDPKAPKHRGISYILMDMKSPGVTIRPLWLMSGGRVNELFMDNVRVPKKNLVGDLNRGWYVAMTTLSFERSGIVHVAEARRTLEELVEYARETRYNGKPLSQVPLVRSKLAERAVEVEVARMLAYRIAWMQSRDEQPQAEASMGKVFASELNQRLANTGLQIMGLYGPLQEGSPWAPLEGRLEHIYRAHILLTLVAGTSEVQRMIIATRGLRLPRD
ncbi:MAG: acyl-CoA dehydrogenase family protein [Chloroflexota bacterium]|nr:acyl-CoA dehydrogenase family protein [Chloroflexota bacterium]